MLLGLRHPSIVGRDNQQREVDGANAGHPVLHEVLWPAIHMPTWMTTIDGGTQIEMAKPRVDGDASRLLFRKRSGSVR